MSIGYDPKRHHRRSLRLKTYDYASAGCYFITVCTQDRLCLFGDIDDIGMQLIEPGTMVAEMWEEIPSRFPHVILDAMVVMPNHVHGIIVLTAPTAPEWAPFAGAPAEGAAPAIGASARVAPTNVGGVTASTGAPGMRAPTRGAPTGGAAAVTGRPTVGAVVGVFKSLTTVAYARGVEARGWPRFRGRLWQRNFYEHVIRDETSMNRIREYIAGNPARWADDPENPARGSDRGR